MSEQPPTKQEYVIARMHDVSVEYMAAFADAIARVSKLHKTKVFMRQPTDGTVGVEFVEIAEVADV